MIAFDQRVAEVDSSALCATGVDVLELNVGLRCNMHCSHCHQGSSPARSEAMDEQVFTQALRLADRLRPRGVDLTGGAPELHPRIGDWIGRLRQEGHPVSLRSNLTALLAPEASGVAALLAREGVRVIASMPHWAPELVGRQRGATAFTQSLRALRLLGELGYGRGDGLALDLVYNPSGPTLPEPECTLAERFRSELGAAHGVAFDSLVVLTNMPIGRFAAALGLEGTAAYLETLAAAFNPATVPRLACRRTLVVAWDGTLWDCDFNLGAGLRLAVEPRTVDQYDESLLSRRIAFGAHCYACTAQAGSS